MKKRLHIIIICLLLGTTSAFAQKASVKTNLIWDGLATINLGTEIGIAPRWTIDISGNYNGWIIPEGKRWKHWLVQPEFRYWLCERFQGHFFGLHLHGGQFNLSNLKNNISFLGTDFSKLSDTRYQGWFIGVGIGYGYAFILSKHWNLELEAGFGYSYSRHDRYPCAWCGNKIEENIPHHYVGPTKLAINLAYLF